MMQLRKSIVLLVGVLVGLFMLFPISASAIPFSGLYGETGTFFGPAPGEPYQQEHASVFLGGEGGFGLSLGPEQYIGVWFGDDSGKFKNQIFNVAESELYLLTTSADSTISFDSMPFMSVDTDPDKITGYKPFPYTGVSLGLVSEIIGGTAAGWELIEDGEFASDGKVFYEYTGVLEADLAIGDRFFTAILVPGGSLDLVAAMPNTTSGVATPEPTTMLLGWIACISLRFSGH